MSAHIAWGFAIRRPPEGSSRLFIKKPSSSRAYELSRRGPFYLMVNILSSGAHGHYLVGYSFIFRCSRPSSISTRTFFWTPFLCFVWAAYSFSCSTYFFIWISFWCSIWAANSSSLDSIWYAISLDLEARLVVFSIRSIGKAYWNRLLQSFVYCFNNYRD